VLKTLSCVLEVVTGTMIEAW
jgi:hypothetical protein